MDPNLTSAIITACGSTLVAIVALVLNSKRFEDMGKRFDDINKRFDDLGKRLDDMSARMDRIERRLELSNPISKSSSARSTNTTSASSVLKTRSDSAARP